MYRDSTRQIPICSTTSRTDRRRIRRVPSSQRNWPGFEPGQQIGRLNYYCSLIVVVITPVAMIVSIIVVEVVVTQDLSGGIVSVLLRVEYTPAVAEWLGNFGAEQPVRRWIAVGLMPASNFVVAFVIERSGKSTHR